MYERFTDRARKVMMLANQEAQRCGHDSITALHILFGIVKEEIGVAGHVLRSMDISLTLLRHEIEKRLPAESPGLITAVKLPQSDCAKRVIQAAIEEARGLKHNYVGTEHLLLGILCDDESKAYSVLSQHGLHINAVRDAVLSLVQDKAPAAPAGSLASAVCVAMTGAVNVTPDWVMLKAEDWRRIREALTGDAAAAVMHTWTAANVNVTSVPG